MKLEDKMTQVIQDTETGYWHVLKLQSVHQSEDGARRAALTNQYGREFVNNPDDLVFLRKLSLVLFDSVIEA